jgi:glycyl-tRNA synthetase beta chain
VEVMGPPKKAAYDERGNPTKAAVGFAKNQGVDISELTLVDTKKGEYLCLKKTETGSETKEILRALLPELVLGIPFPKSMRWSTKTIQFTRPIQWILALFNSEIVPFQLDGIESGNATFGHRFLAPERVEVRGADSYLKALRDRYVIVDPEERSQKILDQLREVANRESAAFIEDPELLEWVTFLTEYPVPVVGAFSEEYLELPRELLISTMKKHQRYFSLENSGGKLLPRFIGMSNVEAKNPAPIRSGYERVLKARLADAKFFFDEDRKRPFDSFLEGLKGVVFQKGLGTVFDKTQRIERLAETVIRSTCPEERETALRAARLCKADLVTQMVYEFPELQGIMGREYALACGESGETATAIEEHYWPRFSGDAVPASHAGAAVALGDRLDNLAAFFGLGMIPTGTDDPFALRRQSIGILIIILEKGYRLSLRELLRTAYGLFSGKLKQNESDCLSKLIEFIKARFRVLLTDRGYRYDVIDAAVEQEFDDPRDALDRVRAVNEWKNQAFFEPIVISFKRISNIIKGHHPGPVDPNLFMDDGERNLYNEFQKLKLSVLPLFDQKAYLQALEIIATVRGLIDTFFDEVLVMAEDERVRTNRLNLLSEVAGIYRRVADFSRIVVEKSEE